MVLLSAAYRERQTRRWWVAALSSPGDTSSSIPEERRGRFWRKRDHCERRSRRYNAVRRHVWEGRPAAYQPPPARRAKTSLKYVSGRKILSVLLCVPVSKFKTSKFSLITTQFTCSVAVLFFSGQHAKRSLRNIFCYCREFIRITMELQRQIK